MKIRTQISPIESVIPLQKGLFATDKR